MHAKLDEQLLQTSVSVVTEQLQARGGKVADAMLIFRVILQTCMAVPMLMKNKDLLKEHVAEVIDRLLKGSDNVQGTTDDLITPETAEKIRRFLSDDNLDGFVGIVTSAMSGDLVTAGVETAQVATRCLFACFRP